jgi:hypothetical protein
MSLCFTFQLTLRGFKQLLGVGVALREIYVGTSSVTEKAYSLRVRFLMRPRVARDI